MEQRSYTEAGFLFFSQNQAQIAATEKKKIDYLESKIDYSKPETVLPIYEKAIRERIFMSPVGICYLKKMHDYLEKQSVLSGQTISPVPVYVAFGADLRLQSSTSSEKEEKRAKEESEKVAPLRISIILNCLLVIAVIAMFAITMNASQPNILNYEKAITDRYASWEQDLSRREAVVREKEKELNIQNTGN